MTIRDEVVRNNDGWLKTIIRATRRLLTTSSLRYRITCFKAGICRLIGFIILSLALARFISWDNSLNFSWMPAGLLYVLVFFFVFFYLGIGPLCILFSDIITEMRKYLRNELLQPLRILLINSIKKQYTVEYLLSGFIVYCLVYGALISYTNMKPAIPILNHTLHDELLFRWDGYLMNLLSFGGIISILKQPMITLFFDTVYFQMWTLTSITLVWSFRDPLIFWRFSAAWCVAFILSIPISILFPSLGPAFHKPELFTHLGNTSSIDVMKGLWEHYLSFTKDPATTPIISGNGIVAMPSLHIALVYMSIIVLSKYFPAFKLLLWGFLIIFVIATVYLGWHYVSDGVAGILLGWLSYKISSCWFVENRKVNAD
jgi:membrane-associated phospholipid phosphatase